jgi:hypothetical protein
MDISSFCEADVTLLGEIFPQAAELQADPEMKDIIIWG